MKKRQVKVGDQFGRLVAAAFVGVDHANKMLVRCLCDCGSVVVVRAGNLGRKTNSCGCLKAELIKQRMGKPIKHLAAVHVRNCCKRHTKDTDLTIDDVAELIFSRCFYCEKSPEQVGTIWRRAIRDGREVKRIGIDRIDSTKGYYRGNVVPCCTPCNYIKRDHSVGDLVARLEVFLKNLRTL